MIGQVTCGETHYAEQVGCAPRTATPEDHQKWAMTLWNRMDRDHNDCITKTELACDEFEVVLHSIIAPDTVGKSSVDYGRSAKNLQQIIGYCFRIADKDFDSVISFEEFEGFLKTLRNRRRNPELVFTMYDLDNDGHIDRAEFRELYRYFLGHNPTETEFEADWSQLDLTGSGYAGQAQFASWFRDSTNPVFQQHIEPLIKQVEQEVTETSGKNAVKNLAPKGSPQFDVATVDDYAVFAKAATLGASSLKASAKASPKASAKELKIVKAAEFRRSNPLGGTPNFQEQVRDQHGRYQVRQARHAAVWNETHHHVCGVENVLKPTNQREYFSYVQKPAELKRHLSTSDMQSCKSILKELGKPEPPARKRTPLTCDVDPICPDRYVLGGTMHDRDGMLRTWNERWSSTMSMLNDGCHPDHRSYFTQHSVFEESTAQRWRRFLDQEVTHGVWRPIATKKRHLFPPLGGRMTGRSGTPVPERQVPESVNTTGASPKTLRAPS
jgi:Ca2+-binding EF-hand superfamily protein